MRLFSPQGDGPARRGGQEPISSPDIDKYVLLILFSTMRWKRIRKEKGMEKGIKKSTRQRGLLN